MGGIQHARIQDTFWDEQIAELKNTYGDRFEVASIFSQEEQEGALRGRINPAVLRHVFDWHWQTGAGGVNEGSRADVRFLTVGTKEMMCIAEGMLAEIGYPMPHHA